MQNRANIVKVESRDQIYLDYAESNPQVCFDYVDEHGLCNKKYVNR